MDENVEKLIYDIAACINRIEEYVKGMTQDEFMIDMRTKQAVERNFEIIGEAVNRIKNIDEMIVTMIRDHQKIIGFRNQIIHGYDMIADPITWDIIVNKLPMLKQDLEKISNIA